MLTMRLFSYRFAFQLCFRTSFLNLCLYHEPLWDWWNLRTSSTKSVFKCIL